MIYSTLLSVVSLAWTEYIYGSFINYSSLAGFDVSTAMIFWVLTVKMEAAESYETLISYHLTAQKHTNCSTVVIIFTV